MRKGKGKGKGKKKSKAQLEEERRLAEEEAARIAAEEVERRAEEERQRREEEERLRRERIAFREAEVGRLTAEIEAHAGLLDSQALALEREKRARAASTAWSEYRSCSPRVDAREEADLNTYLSLSRGRSFATVAEALSACEEASLIAADLVRVMAAAAAAGEQARTARCAAFLTRLHADSLAKIDGATARILQLSDRYLDKRRGEIIVTEKSPGGLSFGVWVNWERRGFRMKTLDFSAAGLSCDVPKPLAPQAIAVRCVFLPYDAQTFAAGVVAPGSSEPEASPEDEGVVRDSPFIALGGTFSVEIFEMPPPVRHVKEFSMRPVTHLSEKVNRLAYPSLNPQSAEPFGPPAANAPFLRCQFTVPEGVIVSERPRVGWWNPQAGEWQAEGIEEAEFSAGARLLRFHTLRVGAHGLLHFRGDDLPYRSFSLAVQHVGAGTYGVAPEGPPPLPPAAPFRGQGSGECVRATLSLPRFDVVVDVGVSACRLVAPSLPALERVLGEEMPPADLVTALKRAGIHVCPSDADARRANRGAGVALKDAALEERVCAEVASVAASFDVCSTKFNAAVGAQRALFRVRETSIFTGGNDMTLDYDMCLVELDAASQSARDAPGVGDLPPAAAKCTLLPDMDDAQPRIAAAALGGGRASAYLINAVAGGASQEAVDRVRESSVVFQDTLRTFLRLTRPFTFC